MTCIGVKKYLEVCSLMDIPCALHNNWTGLAGEVGLTIEEVFKIQSRACFPNYSPTNEVITIWSQRQGKSCNLEQFKEKLRILQRFDVLDMLHQQDSWVWTGILGMSSFIALRRITVICRMAMDNWDRRRRTTLTTDNRTNIFVKQCNDNIRTNKRHRRRIECHSNDETYVDFGDNKTYVYAILNFILSLWDVRAIIS